MLRILIGAAVLTAALGGRAAAQEVGGQVSIPWGPGGPSVSMWAAGFPQTSADARVFGGPVPFGHGLSVGWGNGSLGIGTGYTYRAPSGELVASTFQLGIGPLGTVTGGSDVQGFGPGGVTAGGRAGWSNGGPFGTSWGAGVGTQMRSRQQVMLYGPPALVPGR